MRIAYLRKTQPRILALVFDPNEPAMKGLEQAAKRFDLAGSSFSGIGAFSSLTLGYFERERRTYKEINVEEQVEILSLTGNIAAYGNELKVHGHIVAGRSDASVVGGHLLAGTVWPTLEVIVTEPEEKLVRTFDDYVNLPLLDPGTIEGAKQIAL